MAEDYHLASRRSNAEHKIELAVRGAREFLIASDVLAVVEETLEAFDEEHAGDE